MMEDIDFLNTNSKNKDMAEMVIDALQSGTSDEYSEIFSVLRSFKFPEDKDILQELIYHFEDDSFLSWDLRENTVTSWKYGKPDKTFPLDNRSKL